MSDQIEKEGWEEVPYRLGGQTEPSEKIKKPVTLEILKMVAEAGYVHEVEMGIGLVSEPLLVTDGATLINIARRSQAEAWLTESARLRELAELSDNPRWQLVFLNRAKELRTAAGSQLEIVANMQQYIMDHPQAGALIAPKPDSRS